MKRMQERKLTALSLSDRDMTIADDEKDMYCNSSSKVKEERPGLLARGGC